MVLFYVLFALQYCILHILSYTINLIKLRIYLYLKNLLCDFKRKEKFLLSLVRDSIYLNVYYLCGGSKIIF